MGSSMTETRSSSLMARYRKTAGDFQPPSSRMRVIGDAARSSSRAWPQRKPRNPTFFLSAVPAHNCATRRCRPRLASDALTLSNCRLGADLSVGRAREHVGHEAHMAHRDATSKEKALLHTRCIAVSNSASLRFSHTIAAQPSPKITAQCQPSVSACGGAPLHKGQISLCIRLVYA